MYVCVYTWVTTALVGDALGSPGVGVALGHPPPQGPPSPPPDWPASGRRWSYSPQSLQSAPPLHQ